jgi:hypothetical protein
LILIDIGGGGSFYMYNIAYWDIKLIYPSSVPQDSHIVFSKVTGTPHSIKMTSVYDGSTSVRYKIVGV